VVAAFPRTARSQRSEARLVPDEVLLDAVARGDDAATRAFVARHAPAVLGLAVSLCGDRGLAEDVTQRAFERAWRHAGAFDPSRASARTWLLTITRRLAIDELRRHRPRPLPPDQLSPLLAPSGSDTERAGLLDAERSVVVRALGQLPEPQRRAVVLAALQGRTASEVAELEGVPLGTAKTRIRSGLRRLRGILGEEVDRG
jgi:RNA polymerase sigma-70 factor (ECF subfamily)